MIIAGIFSAVSNFAQLAGIHSCVCVFFSSFYLLKYRVWAVATYRIMGRMECYDQDKRKE